MNRRIIGWTLWVWLLCGGLVLSVAQAQESDLEETLAEVDEAYARAYLNPLADALGADLNTGLFHTARISRLGIDVYVGVEVSAVFLPQSALYFDLEYDDILDLDVDLGVTSIEAQIPGTVRVEDAPTVLGRTDPAFGSATVQYDTTTTYVGILFPVSVDTMLTDIETIGGLVETDIAPLAVPHIQLGSLFGTEVVVRWLPEITVTNVGSVSLLGFGVRHSLSQYIPLFPIDVAVQAMWQRIHVGTTSSPDLLEARTFAFSIQASRRWRALTFYGGLQNEDAETHFDYNTTNGPVAFTEVGVVKSRGTLGIDLKVGPAHFGGGVSFNNAGYTVVSTRLGFSF